MPLIRYFLFAGATLLGLLFLADWYFPISASTASGDDIDRTIIRIHSSHRWPDAVHIDASMPMPQSAPSALIADNAPPENAAAPPARQAYAYVPQPARKSSGRVARRVVGSTSRRYARDTQRRLASSQPNWFPW